MDLVPCQICFGKEGLTSFVLLLMQIYELAALGVTALFVTSSTMSSVSISYFLPLFSGTTMSLLKTME